MSGNRQAIVVAATGATWSYIVLDFLIHAVVLPPWWRATQSFWLPPRELARHIPFAYVAFAIFCWSLTALLAALYGDRPPVVTDLRFGAIAGIVFGVTSALGAYSVVQLPTSFLVVGPASTGVASAGAGAAASWVLTGGRGWRRVGILLAVGFAVFVVGIVAQNVAPGLRI